MAATLSLYVAGCWVTTVSAGHRGHNPGVTTVSAGPRGHNWVLANKSAVHLGHRYVVTTGVAQPSGYTKAVTMVHPSPYSQSSCDRGGQRPPR